jgi:dephospho-CoA kinase
MHGTFYFINQWNLYFGSMLKVGLTGGIGSGKTTVAKIFELLNVPVYYADQASKRLYHTDKQLISEIKKYFGEDVYTNDVLNRSKLASIVFSNPTKLDLLNELVHPPTLRDAEEWMKRQTAPYVIKEAALLFESGSASGLDYVVGVQAPSHYRIKRAMERDGLKREEVLGRMNRQIDEDIKLRLCDFVIINNEQELVIPQVLELHRRFVGLMSSAKGGET